MSTRIRASFRDSHPELAVDFGKSKHVTRTPMPDKSMLFVGIDMNTHRYPTNITAVRQAIVHAINFTSISDKVFFGGLNPMVGPEYPAQSQYYDLGNLPPYQYNITLAQSILKNAWIKLQNCPQWNSGSSRVAATVNQRQKLCKQILRKLG